MDKYTWKINKIKTAFLLQTIEMVSTGSSFSGSVLDTIVASCSYLYQVVASSIVQQFDQFDQKKNNLIQIWSEKILFKVMFSNLINFSALLSSVS